GVGSDRLADLLAAHAAAARADQRADRLARPVRGAHRSPMRATRERSMLRLTIARLATAQAAAALVILGGGVALAAGTGHMPGIGPPGEHGSARLPADVTAGEHLPASSASATSLGSTSGDPSQ